MPGSEKMRLGCVLEFDPKKSTYRTKQWIYKLEQLQQIYGWTEPAIIFHTQAKLRGLARE